MEKSILVIYSHTVKNSINHVSCTLWDFFGKGNNIQDWSEKGPALDLLTRMCSNSLSVSTLTDWLMILSSEELALCADSSLPCGSHCLQRSTKDLKGYTGAQLPANHQILFFFFFFKLQTENVQLNNESFIYLRGGQQLTRAMVLETYPSPRSPNSAWVSWNISTFLWKLVT